MRTSLDGSSGIDSSPSSVPGSWKRTFDATLASIFWWCWSTIDCTCKYSQFRKIAKIMLQQMKNEGDQEMAEVNMAMRND